MYLKEDLLDQGRHVYADNWRTSIHLTEKPLQKNVYLTGICKKRRKVTAKGVNAEETAQGRVKSCAKSEWHEILIWLSRKKCNDYDSIRLATWIWARISLELLKLQQEQGVCGPHRPMTAYSPFLRRTKNSACLLLFHSFISCESLLQIYVYTFSFRP
ncbi:hypothetical protein KIN20_029143 [Parelaphostrongylus tenuis]|uniref:PiggyBac transposable element-derived protein domain-containing protein n=1 Tax=Parelaphostrongylus tenuis TaxID=148309 RepID=A0AAD5R1W4_PARTN|nr:hypothetical protein KIN20_029143 [Parelaphostrongylus tenuis]